MVIFSVTAYGACHLEETFVKQHPSVNNLLRPLLFFSLSSADLLDDF